MTRVCMASSFFIIILIFRVENVEGVKLPIVNETFSSHKDHSKWAVSETINEPWVCIGDINRAVSNCQSIFFTNFMQKYQRLYIYARV